MSVLIKGMDMPISCFGCDFQNPFVDDPYCRRLMKTCPKTRRLEDCPLGEVLDPEEFARQMRDCGLGTNNEAIHIWADDLMCDVLRALGYEEGVKVFEELPKWYS